MVTEIIRKRRSLQAAFCDRDDPVRPPYHAGRYLIDQTVAFFAEAPKTFHREEFLAALVEGHLARTSVVIALARLGGGSS